MGSFSSKHKFVQVATAPKPAEVLPATESWSTLDAFQNMVKENEQRKLIYRSKTREALCKTNSLRRHKTLANLPSSSKQSSKINKKPMNVCVKTQSNLSQTGITVDERDHIRPLSHIRKRSSESRLNASSRSHNSLAEDIKPDEVGNDDTVSENHPVNISHEIEVATENNIISSQESHSEPLSVANPSTTKLEGAEVVRQSIDSSTDSSTLAFRVDPEPHALFAPESQVNKRELECQSTIAQLAPLPSEELARRQVEEILHQWRNSAQLANIESHALSIPQPTTTAELADSLTNNSVSYIKSIEGKELHIQVAKAYSIYVWIANNIMYNVEQWKAFHSRDNDSLTCNTEAEEVLNTGVTVCTGYANLFKELASKCGLTVELIHGHAKTWRSLSEEKPGADTTFKPSQQNAHTWNSVSNSNTMC